MKFLVWILNSLFVTATAFADPTVFKRTEFSIWEEDDPHVEVFSIGVSGSAAKVMYETLLEKEHEGRGGLFLKSSKDLRMSCQRKQDNTEYFCQVELDR